MALTAAATIMRCSIRANSKPTQFFGPAAQISKVQFIRSFVYPPREKGDHDNGRASVPSDGLSQRSGLNDSGSSQFSTGFLSACLAAERRAYLLGGELHSAESIQRLGLVGKHHVSYGRCSRLVAVERYWPGRAFSRSLSQWHRGASSSLEVEAHPR